MNMYSLGAGNFNYVMCAKLFLREVKDAGWSALTETPWCEREL